MALFLDMFGVLEDERPCDCGCDEDVCDMQVMTAYSWYKKNIPDMPFVYLQDDLETTQLGVVLARVFKNRLQDTDTDRKEQWIRMHRVIADTYGIYRGHRNDVLNRKYYDMFINLASIAQQLSKKESDAERNRMMELANHWKTLARKLLYEYEYDDPTSQ